MGKIKVYQVKCKKEIEDTDVLMEKVNLDSALTFKEIAINYQLLKAFRSQDSYYGTRGFV